MTPAERTAGLAMVLKPVKPQPDWIVISFGADPTDASNSEKLVVARSLIQPGLDTKLESEQLLYGRFVRHGNQLKGNLSLESGADISQQTERLYFEGSALPGSGEFQVKSATYFPANEQPTR